MAFLGRATPDEPGTGFGQSPRQRRAAEYQHDSRRAIEASASAGMPSVKRLIPVSTRTPGMPIKCATASAAACALATASVKVRASAHSKDLRLFEIGADGMVIGERIGDYQGLLTGSPHVGAPGGRLTPRRPGARRPKR